VKTILVVDDELDNAEVLALILEEEGFRSLVAVNGAQGLERVHEFRPDLVLIDFMMPVMNGALMAQTLRADETTRHVKIVMNSVLPEAAVRERFAEYDGFLRKPYGIEALLRLIADLLPPPRA
jgi:CheY-like chemotaxis protein